MGQTDLDKLVGNEAEDITRKVHPGTPRDRGAEMPQDEAVPVKAMPFKETPKPFNMKITGDGG